MAHAAAETQAPETRYTVFIRVPIPRGDFVDPPTVRSLHAFLIDVLMFGKVHWDSSKDRSLWKVLSSASKGSEIDCKCLY